MCVVFASLSLISLASIPARSNLRYREVDGNSLSPNSVSVEDIQEYSAARHNFLNRNVWQSDLGENAINSEQSAPGSVTTTGGSIDLVQLLIKDTNTIPSRTQASVVRIPTGVQSVQPHEAIADANVVIVDNPDVSTAYVVEGKARGPGVILGWYPSMNGHLLRYQASRGLRGIVCSAIDIANIRRNSECFCSVTDAVEGDTEACSCSIDISYINTDFVSEISDCSACTVLDCGDAIARQQDDPMCERNSPDQRENPFDNEGDHLPDRCNPYTSVEDVNNPQEGVPVYSPSVERIEIDNQGNIEMRFFGRGLVEEPHEDIMVTVVVLLDEQYGA